MRQSFNKKLEDHRSKRHAYQELLLKSVDPDRLPLFHEFSENPFQHTEASHKRTLLIMYFVHARWLDPTLIKQLVAQPQVDVNV